MKMTKLRNGSKGDSNPGSLDGESGILPLSHCELCEQGRRRRGRPRLRWEDCVKRDVRKAGEEEDWKKRTRDRGGWKRLSDEAVKKLRAAPHP